jgi:thiol:disulfide interchange protein DsbD
MTETTKTFMRENGIAGLIADKTEESPEIDRLMLELGHSSLGIPLYAIYPSDGRPPIVFSGFLTENTLLERLREAGPSRGFGTKTARATVDR